MLGPLPRRYRAAVAVAALVVFLGGGIWLGALTKLDLMPGTGVLLGGGAAIVVIALMVHDFYAAEPRPIRIVGRRTRS